MSHRLRSGGTFDFRGGGLGLTVHGVAAFDRFGIDVARLSRSRAACRQCLDWSQRRPRLGGAAGAALLTRMTALGWLLPVKKSRALTITARGANGLASLFAA